MNKKKKVVLGAGIGAAVLLGGGYVVSYFLAGDQVPVHASVDGVAIGGMSPDQAEEKLRNELSEKVDAPLRLTAGEVTVELVPAESGLSVDYAATVARAGGGASWNPVSIFQTLTGGGEVDLVRNIDDEQLKTAVGGVAEAFAVEPVDATLGFADGKIARTDSVDAQALNVDETVTVVSDAFEAGEDTAAAVVETTSPTVTNAMVDEAVKNYAEPLLSGPVTLTAEGKSMEISAEKLSAVTTFAAADGQLKPTINGETLYEDTSEEQEALGLDGAKDASFKFSGGGVVVVPAEEGRGVTAETLTEAVQKVAFSTEERSTEVKVDTQEPEFTTEEAEELGTFEVIGEFTTYYPHSAYRNTNLGQATKTINGTVLMPDEIFSLNDTLGPRTAANGYVEGYVINGGRMVMEQGGGISQSATTLYNAAFFAGYKEIERKPHSLYFSRYPAGREATVYYGQLDLKFQNDTEYPSIIQGYINPSTSSSKGSITFKIWSKRTWDKVESTEPVKSDFYSGGEKVVTAADCSPQSPIQGFTATWKRLFYKNGAVVKTEDYSWKYSAGDKITCG